MNSLLAKIQAALKIRTIIVFLLVHIGLAVGIFALARASYEGWDLTSTLFLLSTVFIYGGFLLAVLFVALPLVSLAKKAERFDSWTSRLIHELPALIDQLPKLVLVFESLLRAWKEAKNREITSKKSDV